MEKSCDNCKHAHKSYRDMPCLTCKTVEHSNWEAKTETKETLPKGGEKNDDSE